MEYENYPRSLTEARECGAKFYFTGKHCREGHLELRYTSCAECVVCRRAKSSARHEENKDEILAQMRKYSKEKYHSDEEHRLKILEWQKEYREQNREKRRESHRKYVRNNKERVKVGAIKYYYKRKKAVNAYSSDELTEFAFSEARELCNLRKEVTGYDWEVDHVVPLISDKVCGLHKWTNFAVIPASVNRSKRNVYWPDMP
jgi:hypothetical protein